MRFLWCSEECAGHAAGTADPTAVLFFFRGQQRAVSGEDEAHCVFTVQRIRRNPDRNTEGMPAARDPRKAIFDLSFDPVCE